MRWVVLASFESYGKKPQKVKYFVSSQIITIFHSWDWK